MTGADAMGGWLQDHDDYLIGRISYDELQRRNGERYRAAPALCGSPALTDSQERLAREGERERLELAAQVAEREREHESRYRRACVWAALSVLLFAIGLALVVVCCVMGEILVLAVMLNPLWWSFLEAARRVDRWRHFDE